MSSAENQPDSHQGAYQTADLPLASFLQVLGHEIIEIRSDSGRGIFVFPDSPELRANILAWANDKPVLIRVKAFVEATKNLKGAVGLK